MKRNGFVRLYWALSFSDVVIKESAIVLAKRNEEKKQIVSGLQHVKNLEALDMLGKYMDDPALQAEARISTANLIWDLRASHPTEARAMARQLPASKDRAVAEKARKTISDLDKNKR